MTDTPKRGRGRPRSIPMDGQRYSISTNVSADTRKKLEAAADRNGQSIAKEADDRIRQSLLDDEYMGDSMTAQLFRTMAGVVWEVEHAFGKKWSKDPETAFAVESALAASIQPLLRTVSLDRVGELALMDVDDFESQKPDADTRAQVVVRKGLYDAASQFGISVAFRARSNAG